ncbi:NTP transferase domain-containing protein [Rhizobium leguminosarum]|uniref:nucleotidyltransferase family protein n=1 Tax=Rhizobium leguminosarum TaxID=384 RepID=UPI001C94C094|nr:NTP transferase domain-containing protein [Rhizobium leguminosarum]MBY5537729.1 NTP transferase domain-containing protein [Rhizobium leguminosarum]
MADRLDDVSDQVASVAILVLAAGKSSRTSQDGVHKLLSSFGGETLVRRSVRVAVESRGRSVTVVTGSRCEEIDRSISDTGVRVVRNIAYEHGIGTSISAGVAKIEEDRPEGVLVLLADMPLLESTALDSLILAFSSEQGACIVRATAGLLPGNPSGVPIVDVEIGDGAQVDVDTVQAIISAGGTIG